MKKCSNPKCPNPRMAARSKCQRCLRANAQWMARKRPVFLRSPKLDKTVSGYFMPSAARKAGLAA